MNQTSFAHFFVAPFLVLAASVVLAEETIDEIVVTADFRERSVTELPISVSVLDAAYIEEAAVQHFEERLQREELYLRRAG